jgi:hypothetical protein
MADEIDKKIKLLVSSESKRLVTKIFKYSLTILEDLRYHHAAATEKLEGLKPEEIESLNYLNFSKYSLLRKRILDNGNEGIRDLENFLDNFDFNLKNKEPITYKKEKGL